MCAVRPHADAAWHSFPDHCAGCPCEPVPMPVPVPGLTSSCSPAGAPPAPLTPLHTPLQPPQLPTLQPKVGALPSIVIQTCKRQSHPRAQPQKSVQRMLYSCSEHVSGCVRLHTTNVLWIDQPENSFEGRKVLILILGELSICDLKVCHFTLLLGGYNLLFLGGCGPKLDEDPNVTAVWSRRWECNRTTAGA